jgi:hypothetical protein
MTTTPTPGDQAAAEWITVWCEYLDPEAKQ